VVRHPRPPWITDRSENQLRRGAGGAQVVDVENWRGRVPKAAALDQAPQMRAILSLVAYLGLRRQEIGGIERDGVLEVRACCGSSRGKVSTPAYRPLGQRALGHDHAAGSIADDVI